MHEPLRDLLCRGGLPGAGGRRDNDRQAGGAAEDQPGEDCHAELYPADPCHAQQACHRRQGLQRQVSRQRRIYIQNFNNHTSMLGKQAAQNIFSEFSQSEKIKDFNAR